MKAILDLGTNTFNLLVGSNSNGVLTIHVDDEIPVMLGKGGIQQGVIAEDAFQRGLAALSTFKQSLIPFEPIEVVAFATSAIRNASNGAAFLKQAQTQFGFKTRTIDGNEEAETIYQGVSHSFRMPETPVLVMDIGGGSVELIIGRQEQILWKQSFEIGASRLLAQFKMSDPMTSAEINTIESFILESTSSLTEAISRFDPAMLIGSAGSFESMREVLQLDLGISPEPISENATGMSEDSFIKCYEHILDCDDSKRKQMKGLVDFRLHTILPAMMLTKVTLNRLKHRSVVVSRYSLKEGMLLR